MTGATGRCIIDVDSHNAVPDISALFPYLSDQWRDYCVEHGVTSLAPSYYPPGSPLSSQPDAKSGTGEAGAEPGDFQSQLLDPRGVAYTILNCLYAVQSIRNEHWASAMAQAVNDWQARTWLAVDERFRGSIVVPTQSPEQAANEIERLAHNPGFVQVLLPTFTDVPLGKRFYWPIYDAASRHRLPVGVHPAVGGLNPLTPIGWSSYYIEDYAAAALAHQSQLLSLICEGVFEKYPRLLVVLLESGVTWLPSLMWRLDKNWKGLRREIPWVDRPPSELVSDHVRLSSQPFDCPDEPAHISAALEQLGSIELLLFSTDYPHWHRYNSADALLAQLSPSEQEQFLYRNAQQIYRITERPENQGVRR